jgi:hypothetical protein
MMGVFLEMIPILNFFTPITNIVGSALWACDIERYKEPLKHPRVFSHTASYQILESEQIDYGSMKNEQEQPLTPLHEDPKTSDVNP